MQRRRFDAHWRRWTRHRELALTLCVAVVLCSAAGAARAALLWFDGERPAAQAREAIALLADAAADGLDPADYDAAGLQRELAAATDGPPPTPDARSRFDAALTIAMKRFLTDLHHGRIEPRRIHEHLNVPPALPFDAAAALSAALAANRLPEAVREAAPRLQLYANLRQVLAGYRELGAHPAWHSRLPRPPNGALQPGQPYAGLPLLAQRLQVLGDLAADSPLPETYDGPLVDAVRAFQRRHGLAEDGIVGRATLTALEIAPMQRARQIALMLERLRWTPLLQGPRMIVVNVPEFVLRAYEVTGDRVDVKLQMRVIVGRALETRTPLINEDMRFIEFSPYWNVPLSIARDEIVPRLRRDPPYFAQQGFEFVAPDGRLSTALDAGQLDAVLRGDLRIRQRPGPLNALGDIKFVFPNNESIYLHHTPTPQLFARDRRDFSHGCIRVEAPVALARFVLQDQPDWTEERIRDAMTTGTSRTLRLQQPLPVLITYGTALVKNGRPYFFEDLYGLDQVLERALRQRPASRVIRPATVPSR